MVERLWTILSPEKPSMVAAAEEWAKEPSSGWATTGSLAVSGGLREWRGLTLSTAPATVQIPIRKAR